MRHSLTSQLRTLIIQHAQGWDDLSDTQLLGEDPAFQLAYSDQRSTTPLTQQRPSQPTLSRLLNLLAQVRVRFDAGFTGDPTLSALDRASIPFVGRIKSNRTLESMAQPYLKRPVGRPPEQLRGVVLRVLLQGRKLGSTPTHCTGGQ